MLFQEQEIYKSDAWLYFMLYCSIEASPLSLAVTRTGLRHGAVRETVVFLARPPPPPSQLRPSKVARYLVSNHSQLYVQRPLAVRSVTLMLFLSH